MSEGYRRFKPFSAAIWLPEAYGQSRKPRREEFEPATASISEISFSVLPSQPCRSPRSSWQAPGLRENAACASGIIIAANASSPFGRSLAAATRTIAAGLGTTGSDVQALWGVPRG